MSKTGLKKVIRFIKHKILACLMMAFSFVLLFPHTASAKVATDRPIYFVSLPMGFTHVRESERTIYPSYKSGASKTVLKYPGAEKNMDICVSASKSYVNSFANPTIFEAIGKTPVTGIQVYIPETSRDDPAYGFIPFCSTSGDNTIWNVESASTDNRDYSVYVIVPTDLKPISGESQTDASTSTSTTTNNDSGSTSTSQNPGSHSSNWSYPYNKDNQLTGAVITLSNVDENLNPLGTTSGDVQNYTSQSTTIKATAKEGYVFDHWEKNGVDIGGSSSMEVQCEGSIDVYMAVFRSVNDQFSYGVHVEADNPYSGSVSGGKLYEGVETSTTIIAAPASRSGVYFDHWDIKKYYRNTPSTYTITMEASFSPEWTVPVKKSIDYYIAYFTTTPRGVFVEAETRDKDNQTLSDAGGKVSGGGLRRVNGSIQSSYTISAYPETGYYFDHWEIKSSKYDGSDSTGQSFYSSEQTLTVNTSELHDVYTAVFKKEEDAKGVYTSVKELDGKIPGTTSGDTPRKVNGQKINQTTITAYPNKYKDTDGNEKKYVFNHWELSVNGEGAKEISPSNPYTVAVRNYRDVYTAVFDKMWGVKVTVSEESTGYGTVTGSTDGYVNGAEVHQTTLQAYPESDDYEFDCWKIGDEQVSDANPYTVQIERESGEYITYTAVFKAKINSDGVFTSVEEIDGKIPGTTSGDTPRKVNGQKINQTTIIATPKRGYSFDCWKLNGEEVSDKSTYTVNVRDQRDLYIACFTLSSQADGVYTEPDNPLHGSTSGDTYREIDGQEITQTTIQAFPSSNEWVFDYWELVSDEMSSGSKVSISNPYTVKVYDRMDTYIAHFKKRNGVTNPDIQITRHATGIVERITGNKERQFTLPVLGVDRNYVLALAENAAMDSSSRYSKPAPYSGNSPALVSLSNNLQVKEKKDESLVKDSGFDFITSDGEIISINSVNINSQITELAEKITKETYGKIYSTEVLYAAETLVPANFEDGKRTIVWSGTGASKGNQLFIIQVTGTDTKVIIPIADDNGKLTFTTSDFADSRFVLVKTGYKQ